MANNKVEKIILKNSIKTYAIENEKGELIAELKLDVDDDSTLSRFLDMYDNVEKIYDEAQAEFGKWAMDDIDLDGCKALSDVNIRAIKAVIEETDRMFGRDFVKTIFKEHYALNEDFVPSITLISEFYQQIMPIIKNVYSSKTKAYSVTKGK